ncbi:Flavoredoxin [compost metagenome]
MTYISVRKNRHSHSIIKENMEFCINLTNEDIAFATDYCGVRSGKNEDKFKAMNLTKQDATVVKCPMIKESPVNIECRVKEIKELGSHDMFLAEIVAVNVDDKYMDENGRFDMQACKLIAYSHGQYYKLGENIGKFGYSVRKK